MSNEDSQVGGFEYTLPVKAGQITGDERVPVALTVGVAATEVNLTALIGNSPGAWITFEVRDAGPLYVGMNKAASSGTTLTAGVGSLGTRIQASDQPQSFWVEKSMPFIEVIADAASTDIVYRRSNPNRKVRNNVMATGH